MGDCRTPSRQERDSVSVSRRTKRNDNRWLKSCPERVAKTLSETLRETAFSSNQPMANIATRRTPFDPPNWPANFPKKNSHYIYLYSERD